MTRLDIGIASYGNPDKLNHCITQIKKLSGTDWRLFVINNRHPDPQVEAATRAVIATHAEDERVVPRLRDDNIGYAGAVNELFECAETEFVAYVDNDCYVKTFDWDVVLMGYLQRHHELGMVFPGGGAYELQRASYVEVLWGVGYCWVVSAARVQEVGGFDETLGHQEEVDFQTRLRLRGWRCAAAREVQASHDATASSDPAAQDRINQGVINWVTKWNAYFVGPNVTYYSPNVLRFEDWPPNALYLEEWMQQQPELKALNRDPETLYIKALGREVDLIRVPRWQHLYRDRII